MKMAVCGHIGPVMTAFTMSITQLCVNEDDAGGWSDSWKWGTTHVTAGRRSALMSTTRSSTLCRQCSCHRSLWNTLPMPLNEFHMYPRTPGGGEENAQSTPFEVSCSPTAGSVMHVSCFWT